jgi:protein SSD1
VEQLAIQQQIELLQQQQQQLQATYQQMSMLPGQPLGGAAGYNPMQAAMSNMSPQAGFQFPTQLPQQNMPLAPPTQPLSHRRNQSALPNMGMGMGMGGPPPAPSSGASGSAFGSFDNSQNQGRENFGGRGGRGGGGGGGGGHQRRHSLALADAKKAAEVAQQKRTTSGFQFPAPGASGSAEKPEDEATGAGPAPPPAESQTAPGPSFRGGRGGGHGRSQSMAVGANSRGGLSDNFPRRGGGGGGAGGGGGHARTSSRNFDGNWRNQSQNQGQDQTSGAGQNQGFQPGHRSRSSISHQSISSIGQFQYPGQPQLMQLPGQMMIPGLYPGQQLNPMQLNQLQALQVASMNGQHMGGLQASQHAPQMPAQQQQGQQQQRKTLFTPYLPQATLPALLGDGQLVSGILRVNKKNRSDAYVSTSDGLLDADIFICGSKDRNRALEGDLVAVELLDVDEVWGQKREKEEKKKRKDITDTRSGSTAGTSQGGANGDDSGAGDGGIRRRGSLRQRPTQKKNDDVEVEGQSLLLVEEEEISDEQKPLYAGHIVAVIERVPGQMFSGNLGLLRPSSQATKEKQEAERAARDGSVSRHQEPRMQDKPKIVWFKPTDKRVPLIAIPTEQAPRDFVEKHQDYADQIFVACIKRWPITSLHPFGTLVEKLGRMGDLKVETDALLRDNNFASDEFSDAVLRSVGLQDWTIEKEEEAAIASRRDFRSEKVFTLDLDGSTDLGNGIHVKSLPDGKVEIGIHVPDVTHFVKPNSLVDREAKKRGTAVHLINRFCALLPPKLSSEICSLSPKEDRLTVSVVFHVHPHTGAVAEGDIWIGKGIVQSGGRLSLSQMDEALSGAAGFAHDAVEANDIRILNVSFRLIVLRR